MWLAHQLHALVVRVQQVADGLCSSALSVAVNENGIGSASPCSTWNTPRLTPSSKSIDLRASRGGVPVFSRPHAKPRALIDSARSREGGSSARPAGRCSRPTWTRPFRKVPVVMTSDLQRKLRPSSSSRPQILAAIEQNPPGAAENPLDIRLGLERGAHPLAVPRLVRLGARRPHRRPAAAIEQLELYAGSVDCAAHQSAQRIDLSDQMSLRRAADRRIARHVRDGFSSERAQSDAAAELRRRPRGLDAGVAGADDNHI